MVIKYGSAVGIEYTLKIKGRTIDSNVGRSPLKITHGKQQLVPGLENQLEGMDVGEQKSITVDSCDGYGEKNQQALLEVAKDTVPEQAHKVGTQIAMKDPQGKTMRAVVSDVLDDTLILDFNHPLAGQTLEYEVRVLSVN